MLLSFFLIFSFLSCFFFYFYCFFYFDFFYHSFFVVLKLTPSFFFFENEIGFDSFSILFLMLTFFLFPLCFLSVFKTVKYKLDFFCFLLFVSFIVLFFFFSSLNFFTLYIWFEAILLPFFLLIGIWGSRFRKIHASYQFFLYTSFGSLLMLCALCFLFFFYGTLNFSLLFDYVYFQLFYLSDTIGIFQFLFIVSFIFLFIGFSVKVPLFPFHLWLPEAHVEAPTVGSVILAGILLKLGTYGLFRMLFFLYPFFSIYFFPLIALLCVLGINYASCSTIIQTDLKKIVAYSSIAHMSLAVLGLFSFNVYAIAGSIFLMISHGIISSALFFLIGFLYDRFKTRFIFYLIGLLKVMPIFCFFFFLFILGNVSFPATSAFVAEFLITLGLAQLDLTLCFLSSIGMLLGIIYNFWLLVRLLFGTYSPSLKFFSDLTFKECLVLFPLSLLMFFLGIFPMFLISSFFVPLTYLIAYLHIVFPL